MQISISMLLSPTGETATTIRSRKLLAESDVAKGMDLIEYGHAAQGLAHLNRALELDPGNSAARELVSATLINRCENHM